MRILKVFIGFCTIVILARGVYAQEKNEIVLGCETSLLPSLVWVAENRGYFQKEGIRVQIKEFGSGRTALRTMLEEGNLDMVTVAQTPIVLNSFKRDDFVIISGMVYSHNDVKMLGRKDRGVTNISDLKGKTIGMTHGSTGHYYLGLALSTEGIGTSEVRLVDLEASKLAEALAEGQVDAISTWEPHIYNAKMRLGDKARPLVLPKIFREDFYFAANRNFLKDNPDTIKKFLKAVKRAEEFIQKHKEEAKDIVSRRLKIDRSLVDTIWGDFVFKLFLDQSIPAVLEEEAHWAIKEGLTDKKETPDYLNFIYTDALKEVKPKAVNIIQ